jgi:AcrR family transcriptional regulator
VEGDPREQILEVAGRLFTAQGYAATGTREIAAAVGLEQPSIFHWFARKEDILAELLDRTVSPALATGDLLKDKRADLEERLYALARGDVANLCSGPVNLAALQLLPEARGEAFTSFWARREELKEQYGSILRELRQAKRLAVTPVGLATDLVFGMVESVINWFDREGAYTSDQVADAVATAVVRAAVAD